MRIEFVLKPEEMRFAIPINYNYLIHQAFSSIFRNSANSDEFRSLMADDICRYKEKGNPKIFTFSKLLNSNSKIVDNTYSAFGNTNLLFSTPMDDDNAASFFSLLQKEKGIHLNFDHHSIFFEFANLTHLPEPEFSDNEKFIMLSPTTISKITNDSGYRMIHFHRITESETEGAIAYNLRKKYELVHKIPYSGPLLVKFDKQYIATKGGSDGVSKLITIKQNTPQEFKIKGFLAPLWIKGNPDIIKTAYQCGIGERNVMGMGMIEKVAHQRNDVKIKAPGIYSKSHSLPVFNNVGELI